MLGTKCFADFLFECVIVLCFSIGWYIWLLSVATFVCCLGLLVVLIFCCSVYLGLLC